MDFVALNLKGQGLGLRVPVPIDMPGAAVPHLLVARKGELVIALIGGAGRVPQATPPNPRRS
jgi:hypothetical protein